MLAPWSGKSAWFQAHKTELHSVITYTVNRILGQGSLTEAQLHNSNLSNLCKQVSHQGLLRDPQPNRGLLVTIPSCGACQILTCHADLPWTGTSCWTSCSIHLTACMCNCMYVQLHVYTTVCTFTCMKEDYLQLHEGRLQAEGRPTGCLTCMSCQIWTARSPCCSAMQQRSTALYSSWLRGTGAPGTRAV